MVTTWLAPSVFAVAIVANGLLAGLYFAFACAISPSLRRTDNLSYVTTMRAINSTILNGWFLTIFFLAPVSAVTSAVIIIDRAPTSQSIALLAAAVCSASTFAITVGANVPLNRALDRAAIQTTQQPAVARARFEARWNRWNLIRTITGVGALGMLTVASLV